MDVLANVVSLVLEPFAFVYVAVRVDESSFTVSEVVAPVSFVKRTVLPDLLALAVALTFFPLPDVYGPVLELLLSIALFGVPRGALRPANQRHPVGRYRMKMPRVGPRLFKPLQ